MREFWKWFGICSVFAVIIGGGLLFVIGKVGPVADYQKYQTKAQASEAKILLTALYTAEKSFQIEHDFYTTDLETIGFMPDAPRFYEIGFVKPSKDPAPSGDMDVKTEPKRMLFTKGGLQSDATQRLPAQATEHCADCTADKEHFKAFAVGHVGRSGALDVWTVDETHRLVHVVDATAQ